MGSPLVRAGCRRRGRRGRLATLGALLVASTVAQSSAALADEQSAEQLFQEGLAAMKRSDFPVACEAFSQSNKADPSPGTQINLAVCFEKQKKWASAWTWYRSAVGLAQQRGQKEREQLADDSATRLRSQLHYVVVGVKEPVNDLVVRRDGNEVTITVAGRELPMPIDPGEHTIEVSGRGKKPWTKAVLIADNAQTERIDVPKLEDAPVDTRTAGGSVPGADRHASGGSDGSGQRTVGIVVGASGLLAALAAGGVFIAAKGEASNRDKQAAAADKATGLEKAADQKSASSYDSAAKNDQLISLILGGGAIVLVGVGVLLYVTAPKSAEKAARLQLTPLASPTFAGMGLGGTF